MKRNALWYLLLVLLLVACASGAPGAPATLPTTPVAAPPATSTAAVTSATPADVVEPAPTAVPSATAAPSETPRPSATPVPTMLPATSEPSELTGAIPPARDNVRLAEAYRGLLAVALPTAVPLVTEPLPLGARDTFQVIDVVNNRVSAIEAELLGLSEHAYFWFQVLPEGIEPEPQRLEDVGATFDLIYEAVTAQFGPEANPGLDGDARLHVLHASPTALCGLDDPNGACGLAGLVNASDLQPAALDPRSNEREMFVMNDRQFGTEYYLGVLAHEFRHMIEFNYEQAGTDWEKEGSAVLAAELVGLPSGGIERGNQFLANPDQQLTNWAETGTSPYYGQGYLLNQYLFNRLGPILYREFAMSALPGFAAIDEVAAANGLDVSGESLWLDWLVALAIHDRPEAPAMYRFDKEGLQAAVSQTLPSGRGQILGQVSQYAADYYQLPSDAKSIEFSGDPEIALLAGQPAGDERFWYGQRANYSNPRLTRAVDLRELSSATLSYDVYVDLEQGYDFGYAAVSVDDGRSWTPLAGEAMQGADPADNPAGSALAERFYTGRRQQWQRETIDLTPYAGQEILLRFEVVTDPILTYSGLAIDNIHIPEVGFRDDGSALDAGWEAEGFSLVTAAQPQSWHLQLVTFVDGEMQVTPVVVDSAGRAMLKLDTPLGEPAPLLVVAATAPMTLEPARYRLKVVE